MPTIRARTAASIADRLTDIVVDHVTSFATTYAPGFELPKVFAGYPVGSDVRADLAFALALLHEGGTDHIAGSSVVDAIATVLRPIDGPETHTFFSYRVAETLARLGGLDDNEVFGDWDTSQRQNLAEACDSTSWYDLLDSGLPANYAAVLARCEIARRSLGLPVDEVQLGDLIDRTRRLIGANKAGFIDDSEDGTGARYDIYSADVYLFTEPFSTDLQPGWDLGFRNVLALVADVAASDGSAMTWGRSLGVLAVCHTIELAALALDRELTDQPGRWLSLAANATDNYSAWTDGTLVNAHKHRSQNRYRGPDRWLQLNFDCLGKLAWAANHLRVVDDATKPTDDPYPPRDKIVWFDEPRHAGVWTHRSASNAFVLPFVGTAWADYLPAPRAPGLYEVPVDAALPTAVPVVEARGGRFVAGGLPVELDHRTDGVDAVWSNFPPLVPTSPDAPIGARRATKFRVEGHVLRFSETLEFDDRPDSVSVQLTETRGRPLRVDVETELDNRVVAIDTDGMYAYRSFWSELPRVHQIEIAPRERMMFEWSVRPLVRIATADPAHHYHRALYDELAGDVVETAFGGHLVSHPSARERLADIDAFHLHWPEWFVETPEQADAFLRLLDETDTSLIWTQHNLRPHREVPGADELYQRFATAAKLVIHHSEWGRQSVQTRYEFGRDARHLVLPHGHFEGLFGAPDDRADVERELDLSPCAIRIAIVGAPRRDKHTQMFMDAFAATTRPDLQLLVLSLDDEQPPDDARVRALPYEFVSREVYNRRMAVVDVIALPFDADGQMLTTGVVGDVVGLGLPAIVSAWPYLAETLGDAGLRYESHDQLVALLESLSTAQLERARRASLGLQERLAWAPIAERFLAAVVDAGLLKM